MGYFPNGTESRLYEVRYCERCVHMQGCAVWLLHLLYNYAECNKPDSFLYVLIPRSKDGLDNEQCRMFYPKPPPDVKEPVLVESEEAKEAA